MEFSRKEQLGLTAQLESPNVPLLRAILSITNSQDLLKREHTGITPITVCITPNPSDTSADFMGSLKPCSIATVYEALW